MIDPRLPSKSHGFSELLADILVKQTLDVPDLSPTLWWPSQDLGLEKVDVIFVPGVRLMAAVAASIWATGLVEEPKVGAARGENVGTSGGNLGIEAAKRVKHLDFTS